MLDYSVLLDGKSDPNQQLKSDLERQALEAQALGMDSEYNDYIKTLSGSSKLRSMADQYNSDPSSFTDAEKAYIKKAAPMANISISAGLEKDKASFGKHALAFVGGIGDSLLFDLLPDRWYSDSRTAKTANIGKWTGTIGSLAFGAAGAINAAKGLGTKALIKGGSALAKAGLQSTDDVVRALAGTYSDDIAKILLRGKALNNADDVAALLANGSADDIIKAISGTSIKGSGSRAINASKKTILGALKETQATASKTYLEQARNVFGNTPKLELETTKEALRAAESAQKTAAIELNKAITSSGDDIAKAAQVQALQSEFTKSSEILKTARTAYRNAWASQSLVPQIKNVLPPGLAQTGFTHLFGKGMNVWQRAAGIGQLVPMIQVLPRNIRPPDWNSYATKEQMPTYYNLLPYGGGMPQGTQEEEDIQQMLGPQQ